MKKLFLVPFLLLGCAAMTGCGSDTSAEIPKTYDDSQPVSEADLGPTAGGSKGTGVSPPPPPPPPQ